MTYDTAKIRQFLNQFFDDEELKHLCFDYFPDVLRDFTGSMPFKQKVQLLLEHCQKYQRFPHLLAALEKERPTVYPTTFPAQSTIEPVSTTAHRNPHQVFISYAHQDSGFAHQLAEDLQAQNIPVWIAPESIHPGEKWVAAINRGLEESGVFLLTLTPHAINSQWVQDETNAAIELHKERLIQFIPLFVKPCSPPPLWRVYQRISFEEEYQAGLRVLLSRLGVSPSVMLNEVREVKHPDGGSPAKAQGILRSADNAQNDGGLRKWLATLQSVPLSVWGVVAVALVLLAWIASSGLGGGNPGATPTTELAQNSPAATQPVPPSVTPTITETALPPTFTSTNTPAPTSSATPTPSRTPPPPAPTATPDPNIPPANASLGDTWTRLTDGMVMVYVPAGSFLMGSADSDPDAFDDEKPQHEVTLDGFWIDRTEVTNDQFATFVEETGHETTAETEGNGYIFTGSSWELVEGANWRHPQGPTSDLTELENHPVVLVSWDDADAYCQWTGGSLPTEAQWEYAARGPENRIYPWGDTFDGSLVNFCDGNCPFDWADETVNDGYEFTSPVGSYPNGQSWVGAMDMAGNVWEWVNDWYNEDYYGISPTENLEGPTEIGSTYKVLRGGSWISAQPNLRAAARDDSTPGARYRLIGFRCLL